MRLLAAYLRDLLLWKACSMRYYIGAVQRPRARHCAPASTRPFSRARRRASRIRSIPMIYTAPASAAPLGTGTMLEPATKGVGALDCWPCHTVRNGLSQPAGASLL